MLSKNKEIYIQEFVSYNLFFVVVRIRLAQDENSLTD